MKYPALILALALTPAAQAADPQPTPLPPPIVQPQDRAYAGQIDLAVDATDMDRHIFRMRETIPVSAAGAMTLLFPKWRPGNHGPTAPLPAFAGLRVSAGGKEIAWQRDAVEMAAFHVDVPAGASALTLSYQLLSPPEEREGRVVTTPNMLEVEWTDNTLYPAGYFARGITVHPSVTLPAGWQFGTALETEAQSGPRVTFKPVTLNVLLDSPLLAGRYFKRVDLDPGGPAPVHLDIVADRIEDLAIKPDDLQAHRNLVQQAYKNFASHHYDHYDFLLSLSDEMGGIGLEHHRSSEDGADRTYFTDPAKAAAGRDLLSHEYTHSWNGKFRRPADLWTPDFTVVPQRDSLLWVYEGQTEYWGQVLAARSGILKPEQVRDLIALEAADMDATPGRAWRNLQDTTNDPIINWHRPSAWRSYARFYDYYAEGLLIWLDADTLIREKSGGARSLTDFARAFFGVDDGSWITHTYTFEDIVAALNAVQPNDWAAFLRARLDGHGPGAPLDGLARGGWRLIYTPQQSDLQKSAGPNAAKDFTFSIGLSLKDAGEVSSVLWNSPAYDAGIAPGTKLIAVNGLAFDSASQVADAITQAKSDTAPIELLLRDGQHFRTAKIDYHRGLRYPHLERIANTPDRLDDILAPVK